MDLGRGAMEEEAIITDNISSGTNKLLSICYMLTGEQGDAGFPGNVGLDGETGEKGSPGLPGLKGLPSFFPGKF